jgi:hypothetical protein
MMAHWEWMVVGFVVGTGLIYVVVRNWHTWRETQRWSRARRRQPIYGVPDISRTRGPQARPTIRRV